MQNCGCCRRWYTKGQFIPSAPVRDVSMYGGSQKRFSWNARYVKRRNKERGFRVFMRRNSISEPCGGNIQKKDILIYFSDRRSQAPHLGNQRYMPISPPLAAR